MPEKNIHDIGICPHLLELLFTSGKSHGDKIKKSTPCTGTNQQKRHESFRRGGISGWDKQCRKWYELLMNWCRISSINSTCHMSVSIVFLWHSIHPNAETVADLAIMRGVQSLERCVSKSSFHSTDFGVKQKQLSIHLHT